MKNWHVFYSIILVFAITGCAASSPPAHVATPEPPVKWKVSIVKKGGCPNVTGEYALIPNVAILQKNGNWRISTGTRFDYVLLIPFDRVGGEKWKPNKKSDAYSSTSLVFETNAQEDVIRIISPINNTKDFVAHVFSKNGDDYTCDSDKLVFPEFQIRGGTEGSILSGRIYRHAMITLGGDLLFYEQVQGQETIHKYYLFKMKDSRGYP